jgi:MFS family permease
VLRALVIAQIFGGAGLAAGVSVGALLAEDLLGSTSSAGLPAALFTAGSAGAAATVGRLSQRYGRRIGLTAGYAAGAAGGAGVVLAAVTEHVPLLLLSMLVYGSGTATNLQCRYAGADLAEESHRGRAVSTVLVATALGAVAGPNLLRLTGDLAEAIDFPRLSGPFMLASAVYATAGTVVALLLRPDPLLTARRLASAGADVVPAAPTTVHPPLELLRAGSAGWWPRRRPLIFAASGMVLAQAVMVAVMTMTPVHLEDHHHDLDAVGLIIGLHIGACTSPHRSPAAWSTASPQRR